ncbi:hypothetical protein GPL15_08370 [Clostridium sp. MCC353]|uniref:hypothetical protein n=1 Tax=Clostridium sp. MCC353 TaxID=2592646 RepID=UPI001C01B9C8|nr:hypothetical protein [Clostridium sp. MCC353]MBT9776517.1 hypothetical protein [Clostridium sp. MCC353]
MLSHDNSKIQNCKLNLWARFHPGFSRDILIPEIEANSTQYHVDPLLVDNFRKYLHAENCLYFIHGFADADIPAGQEYNAIMRINNGVIEPDSIIRCKVTVLCFFSEFKTQPIANAWKGYHASCQIQFHDGIPDIIHELYEITEKKPIKITQELCLCLFDTE